MPDFRPTDTATPAQAILDILGDGKWHSGLELRERGGGHNYTARIGELRLQGYDIQTSDQRGPDGFARYRNLGRHAVGHVVHVRATFSYAELRDAYERKAWQAVKAILDEAWARAQKAQAQYQANLQEGQDAEEINAVLDEILG